jgi:hypothetical protein
LQSYYWCSVRLPHALETYTPCARPTAALCTQANRTKLQPTKPNKQWQNDIWDVDPLRSLFCSFPPPIPLVQQLTVRKAWAQEGRLGDNLYDVVAPTNQMQSAECDGNCFWNSPIFNGTSQDAEFTIEFEGLRGWVEDVKSIVQMDLWRNGTRPERCQVRAARLVELDELSFLFGMLACASPSCAFSFLPP